MPMARVVLELHCTAFRFHWSGRPLSASFQPPSWSDGNPFRATISWLGRRTPVANAIVPWVTVFSCEASKFPVEAATLAPFGFHRLRITSFAFSFHQKTTPPTSCNPLIFDLVLQPTSSESSCNSAVLLDVLMPLSSSVQSLLCDSMDLTTWTNKVLRM